MESVQKNRLFTLIRIMVVCCAGLCLHFTPSWAQPSGGSDTHISEILERNRKVRVAEVENYVRDLMDHDDISRKVQRRFQIDGDVKLPQCHIGASGRHVCASLYDLKIIVDGKALMSLNGLSPKGVGPDRESAWRQSILGVGKKEVYPVIRDMALRLESRQTRESLRTTLENLDKSLWRFSQGMDVDQVLFFLENMIDSM